MSKSSPGAARRLLVYLMMAVMAGCAGPTKTSHTPGLPSLALGPPPAPRAPAIMPPAPKVAEALRLRIFPRADWSLEAPIRDRLVPMGRITRITIHHEGDENLADEAPLADVKAQLRRIQKSHENRMHAGDIGYHYVIDYSGNVWEGRSLKYQGAHAGNNDANKGNIGIVVLGNFEDQQPSAAQLSQLRNLTEALMEKHKVPVSRVYTHREVKKIHGLSATLCPGRYLQSQVSTMRKRLASAEKGK